MGFRLHFVNGIATAQAWVLWAGLAKEFWRTRRRTPVLSGP